MNTVDVAKLTGTVSVLLIFILQFWIAINPRSSKRTLRACVLWFSVWVFFFFTVRILSLTKIATSDELSIILGFSLLIPLVGIIAQLFIEKKVQEELDKISINGEGK